MQKSEASTSSLQVRVLELEKRSEENRGNEDIKQQELQKSLLEMEEKFKKLEDDYGNLQKDNEQVALIRMGVEVELKKREDTVHELRENIQKNSDEFAKQLANTNKEKGEYQAQLREKEQQYQGTMSTMPFFSLTRANPTQLMRSY